VSDAAITFAILGAMVALFVWRPAPNAAVALGGALALYATGVLGLDQALAGFGDRAVLFIASLLVVSAALEASGLTAWVGQVVIRHAGDSETRLLVLTMLLVAALTGLIGVTGAVTAVLPIVVLLAVRLRRAPSRLVLPLAFAAHPASLLLLTGSLVNVVIADAASDAGLEPFGLFELGKVGVPLVAGTILIVALLWRVLIPERYGPTIPDDLSRHAGTLAAQYDLFEGVVRLEVEAGSPLVGRPPRALPLDAERALTVLAVQTRRGHPRRRAPVAAGDVLVVRGRPEAVAAVAAGHGLRPIEDAPGASLEAVLLNRETGFAEVIVPPRSPLVGQRVFEGMTAPGGQLLILGVQRRGRPAGPGEVVVEEGDTLLVQGDWQALDDLHHDPEVVVVDAPDLIRRQSGTLGVGARRALAVVGVMVGGLASGVAPPVVVVLTAALALVTLRVLPVEQAFRAISGTTLVMVAGLIALAAAMRETGAAKSVALELLAQVGGLGTHAVLATLFVLTAGLGQLISSTATALIVTPIAISIAGEIGLDPRTALVTVAVAAAASFLTPVASTCNLVVQAPGGLRFGDYWRLGLPLMLWFFVVATFLVPVLWPA
jgi:di/tricarboxylate transporter